MAFIDGSGKVVRDHVELCPARSDRPSKCSGLGAVFASHPQFDQVAIKPVKTITEKCGRQYAYDVIVHSGVVDATWTALTDVADNPQHY
ncbi:hypothetical protein [Promicromonospora iranensis]|uniref:Uncharacterized protein n=1 Tax=Promicromonospora iranensis TaxID=1105144 RepID=A0ABU2CIQ8_9MICO|nr:hypothetical protein [Promicromonospora iranensis]MDR7381220.1 hypothetical protein [Promicromonospora iranensis]